MSAPTTANGRRLADRQSATRALQVQNIVQPSSKGRRNLIIGKIPQKPLPLFDANKIKPTNGRASKRKPANYRKPR
jgi:hypothetical protein